VAALLTASGVACADGARPHSAGSSDPARAPLTSEFVLISPLGASDQLREFVWQSPIRADRYRVTVRRGTTIVWQSESKTLRIAPPVSGTIERDVQYEWQVEALDREGLVSGTSPASTFVIY